MTAADLLPQPRYCAAGDGVFRLDDGVRILYEPQLERAAVYLNRYLPLRCVCGYPAWARRLSSNGEAGPAIYLGIDRTLAEEEYRLEIGPSGIVVAGGAYGGVFNGMQTLLQLLPPEVYAGRMEWPVEIRSVTICDRPVFGYRGLMLDVARTWIDQPALMRYLDLMAYHKINRLHLHLSDDEGWRLEIESHPELTRVGAWRGGDSPVMPVYGKWNEKYGGFFTKEQMRELIRYAADRNIEIIPEIDLPGHSRNIARVHPEILCRYTPDLSLTAGYDYRSAWCVSREANYRLLEDILGEICELFPSEYIHIGGDEVDVAQWMRCPDCRALMAREGLADGHALQHRFVERICRILTRHGKRPAVWNEAIRRGAPAAGTRVHGWESVGACLEATAQGYETVVMPGAYCYFDMRQSPREAGHDWAAIFDVRKIYGFDFARCGFDARRLAHVIGMEGAFWSEAYVSHRPEEPDYIDYMIFPRLCALSEVVWSEGEREWPAFYTRLRRHYDRMAAMGIRFRLMPPRVSYSDGLLRVTTDDGARIDYTADDGAVHRYETPIRTEHPAGYLFRSTWGTGRSPSVAVPERYRTLQPAVRITSSIAESPRFPFVKAEQYRGIARTARTCRRGDWILYTFADPVVCREIAVNTGNIQLPRFIVTTGYVEASYDGRTFVRVGELEKGGAVIRPEHPLCAVRIVSTCEGNGCPFVTIQSPIVRPVLR